MWVRRGRGENRQKRSGDDLEVSRLGNWANVVLLLKVGNAREEGVLKRMYLVQHWTF